MKWVIIIANLAAAGALYFLGNMAGSAHRAHAYSVYKELQSQHVLSERPDYDVEKRLRTIANGGMYSLWVAKIGSGICIANAVVIGFLLRKSRPDSKAAISN
ncbi:MAG: hypothetical protein JWQ71_2440 [Pedosphaera sp.]|nr:hypothetical protein [Pedosphaera sp.]